MFRGTLAQTAVYLREVAREALRLNAAAVLSHNHPSGHTEPSPADEHLTQGKRVTVEDMNPWR